jgi:putative zinc finger protein
MRECVDEGMLQAYFDGELSSEMMERVATHIASCAQCSALEREIEAESALLTEAFAPELALSVPTGRLRLRLDAAIDELEAQQQQSRNAEHKGARLRSWLGAISAPFSFMPQHAAGFASLIAVAALGLLIAFVIMRPQQKTTLNVAESVKTTNLPTISKTEQSPAVAVTTVNTQEETTPTIVKTAATRGRNSSANARVRRPNADKVKDEFVPQSTESVALAGLLPGERNYLKAIASLDTAIKSGGNNAMRPTLRAEYERNLQVVDEAIAQTRAVAQRNPNDKDAAEFLLSAYQSKVELMNTVAEQAQLSSTYR